MSRQHDNQLPYTLAELKEIGQIANDEWYQKYLGVSALAEDNNPEATEAPQAIVQ